VAYSIHTLRRMPLRLFLLLFAIGLLVFIAMLTVLFGILKKEAIHSAVREGNTREIEAILDQHPEMIEQKDRLGCTPLLEAARVGQIEALKVLIKRGADLNATWDTVATGDGRWSALHIAVNGGHVEAAKVLLEAGADINFKSVRGETPLDRVVYHNRPDSPNTPQLIDLLRAHGGKSGK
jgi:ankyrin repeat protein